MWKNACVLVVKNVLSPTRGNHSTEARLGFCAKGVENSTTVEIKLKSGIIFRNKAVLKLFQIQRFFLSLIVLQYEEDRIKLIPSSILQHASFQLHKTNTPT